MNFKEKVELAWKGMKPPFKITESNEGDEPYLLEKEFAHKPTYQELTHEFLDSSPDGYGSALSFFAGEAFRYYIAAYMLNDMEKEFDMVDVCFSLTHGLDNDSKNEKVNPLRYGEQNWFHYAQAKFSMFNKKQIECIIEYLTHKCEDEASKHGIEQALENYWKPRLNELSKA